MRHYGTHYYQNLENKANCIVAVPDSYFRHQCKRPRGFGEGGLLCKQHAVQQAADRGYLHIEEDRDEAAHAAEWKKQADESKRLTQVAFGHLIADPLNAEMEDQFDCAFRQHKHDANEYRLAKELADREAAEKACKE